MSRPIRQNTPEWLEARRSTIGGSDIAIIAGESPYRSAYTLAAEKLGLLPPEEHDDETRRLLAIGHLMQPALLELYTLETGRRARASHGWRRHPELEWATASLDGTAPTRRVIEAKWTNSRRWRSGERIPGDVYAQVQWQLFVTGWEVADIVALEHGRPRIETIERDDATIADLRYLAEDFRAALARGELPPIDSTESTRRTLAARWPHDDGPRIPATPELADLVAALAGARGDKKAAEERERAAGNALRAILGNAAGIDGLLDYRQNAPSSTPSWPAIAGEYRSLLEPTRATAELDEIVDRHTATTEGARVLRIIEKRPA